MVQQDCSFLLNSICTSLFRQFIDSSLLICFVCISTLWDKSLYMCQVIHGQLPVYTVSSGINEKVSDTLHGDNNYTFTCLVIYREVGLFSEVQDILYQSYSISESNVVDTCREVFYNIIIIILLLLLLCCVLIMESPNIVVCSISAHVQDVLYYGEFLTSSAILYANLTYH